MKLARFFLVLFLIFSILEVLVKLKFLDITSEHYIKPMLMPLLGLSYVFWDKTRRVNYKYLLALFGSFLGDSFLMYDGELYFVVGLICFFIAHIFYITLLMQNLDKSKNNYRLIAFTIIFAYLGLFIPILWSSLGELWLPILSYALVIGIMGFLSIWTFLSLQNKQGNALIFGAVLFMVSDSILAYDLFVWSRSWMAVTIIITYILGQYFLFRYFVSFEER